MPHSRPSAAALRTAAAALCGLGALALGACGDDGARPTAAPLPGRVAVLLTDAPFPYDSVARVELYVDRIEFSAAPDTSPANQAWVTVAAPRRRFDLLTLQQGTTALLGEATVAAGDYRGVRMLVRTDSSYVVHRSGALMPVDWGAAGRHQTLHARVEAPIAVAPGGAPGRAGAVLDFDVGRSFLCLDPFCREPLMFRPALRAVDPAGTGSVAGVVRGGANGADGPPLANVTVTLYRGDRARPEGEWAIAATGKTDSLGRYTVAFLPPGAYILRADAPREAPYAADQRTDVRVTAGQQTAVPDVRLAAAARPGFVIKSIGWVFPVGDSTFVLPEPRLVRDLHGTVWVGSDTAVAWASSDTTVLRVTARGSWADNAQIHAVGPGVAELTATYDGRTATATVWVQPRSPIANLRLVPAAVTSEVGDSVFFRVGPLDAAGDTLYRRLGSLQWTTSGDTLGLLRQDRGPDYSAKWAGLSGVAERPGTSTITATVEGVQATARWVVRPQVADSLLVFASAAGIEPGDTVSIGAALYDTRGVEIWGRRIPLRVSDTTVLGVLALRDSSPIGYPRLTLLARQPGTVTATATYDGLSATREVTVRPRTPVASVAIINNWVWVGDSTLLYAEARSGRETGAWVLRHREFTWAVSDSTVLAIHQNAAGAWIGVGRAVGTVTLTVECEGQRATKLVFVDPVGGRVTAGARPRNATSGTLPPAR